MRLVRLLKYMIVGQLAASRTASSTPLGPATAMVAHGWGTDLTEPDRLALLEYLKTY